uniref:Uncharacterized protein n=1 Tax=Romanomermis culicivorax TaxID=13658 RepID=A0A915KXQ5_ROMCU
MLAAVGGSRRSTVPAWREEEGKKEKREGKRKGEKEKKWEEKRKKWEEKRKKREIESVNQSTNLKKIHQRTNLGNNKL